MNKVMTMKLTKGAILILGCLAHGAVAADALDNWTANDSGIAGDASEVAFGTRTFVAGGAF